MTFVRRSRRHRQASTKRNGPASRPRRWVAVRRTRVGGGAMSMFNDLHGHERKAINHFLFQVTVPILLKQGEKYTLHGTGTLFKVQDESFLVTAGHVLLDDNDEPFGRDDQRGLYCPKDLSGHKPYVRLRGEIVAPRGTPETDVAFLHLKNETAESLQDRRYMELDALLWNPPPGEEGIRIADRFFLCGFPAAVCDVERDAHALRKPFFLLTKLYRGPKVELSPPLDERVHILFNTPNTEMNVETGESWRIRLPHLGGISGCSVWNQWPRHEVPGFWTPEKALKIVAIQTSVAEESQRWIKATAWGALARALYEMLPDLKLERLRPYLDEVLGKPPPPDPPLRA